MRHFGAAGVEVAVLVLVAAAEIIIPRFTLWLSEPLVPVTERVKEPVDDEDDALTVSVEVAGVPVEGVTGPGRLIETPDGAETQPEFSATAELKPFVEVTVIVEVPLPP